MDIKLQDDEFRYIVAHANNAPSVHNIQPARWRLSQASDVIELYGDPKRVLPVADPAHKDVEISMGTAAEGTNISLSRYGLRVREIIQERAGHYTLLLEKHGPIDPLYDYVAKRATWRGKFSGGGVEAVQNFIQETGPDDVCIIGCAQDKKKIAAMNDHASLAFFRNQSYLKETYEWMRFSTKDLRWMKDGLNADSMCLSTAEAWAARFFLRPRIFRLMDNIGVGQFLISDKNKIDSSASIFLFHRPKTESYFDSGRRFYRLWLEIVRAGLHGCPMAAIVDNKQTASALMDEYKIDSTRHLVMAMRIGQVLPEPLISRARLTPDDLIF